MLQVPGPGTLRVPVTWSRICVKRCARATTDGGRNAEKTRWERARRGATEGIIKSSSLDETRGAWKKARELRITFFGH